MSFSTALVKFCQNCYFAEICRFRHVRQLSGAHLAKWPILPKYHLLTAVDKFRQFCHFGKLRLLSSFTNFLGPIWPNDNIIYLNSTALATFVQICHFRQIRQLFEALSSSKTISNHAYISTFLSYNFVNKFGQITPD